MHKVLECSRCGTTVIKNAPDAVSVVCHDCVTDSLKEFEVPIRKVKTTSLGYPKGWKFMKLFVHASGVVYHRGVEQPGMVNTMPVTLTITKIKKSKAQKEKEKQEKLIAYSSLKRLLKKETRKAAIKKLTSQIKKLEKTLKL